MNAKLGLVNSGRLADMDAELFDQNGDAGGSSAERDRVFSQEKVHHSVLMHEEIEGMRG